MKNDLLSAKVEIDGRWSATSLGPGHLRHFCCASAIMTCPPAPIAVPHQQLHTRLSCSRQTKPGLQHTWKPPVMCAREIAVSVLSDLLTPLSSACRVLSTSSNESLTAFVCIGLVLFPTACKSRHLSLRATRPATEWYCRVHASIGAVRQEALMSSVTVKHEAALVR
jgi:hypothetical protein